MKYLNTKFAGMIAVTSTAGKGTRFLIIETVRQVLRGDT